ncbi:MAG: molybdopterin molybdotransferase MoeA [Geminicoccaceae bacterium]|nr:molybdopterin molybdotransferase MoeA [Geminicoccaceae bacterium]
MIEVSEAQERIYAAAPAMPTEWVPLGNALGRVLACDVEARRDQPPRAVSAMDGYAVRSVDASGTMRVVGEVAAGSAVDIGLGSGEAVRIFTGGVLPKGADAVLIQENARREGDMLSATGPVHPGLFVRPQGLDFAAGYRGLRAGRVLDPRALGLAAVMGHGHVGVRIRPRVGVLATGDELRLPGETPEAHQITSSNSTALCAMLRCWGAEPVDLGIARDDRNALADALAHARNVDMLVTTGGASVGEHDLIREVMTGVGIELNFWKIRMRPGKPLIFGRLAERPFLGLPGNPVSTIVCGIMFLRGAVYSSLGLYAGLPWRDAAIAHDLEANDTRRDFVRGFRLDDGRVDVAARQDSSMLAVMSGADVLLERPPFDPARKAGETMRVLDLAEVLHVMV